MLTTFQSRRRGRVEQPLVLGRPALSRGPESAGRPCEPWLGHTPPPLAPPPRPAGLRARPLQFDSSTPIGYVSLRLRLPSRIAPPPRKATPPARQLPRCVRVPAPPLRAIPPHWLHFGFGPAPKTGSFPSLARPRLGPRPLSGSGLPLSPQMPPGPAILGRVQFSGGCALSLTGGAVPQPRPGFWSPGGLFFPP